jgi:hypothetical protein
VPFPPCFNPGLLDFTTSIRKHPQELVLPDRKELFRTIIGFPQEQSQTLVLANLPSGSFFGSPGARTVNLVKIVPGGIGLAGITSRFRFVQR